MRAFGDAADLDVDFGDPDRPGLVTSLLARCGDRHEPEHWWSQPVGLRTASLLRVVAFTEKRDHLSLSARCVAACGESFEFELPTRALPVGDVGPLRIRLDDERTLTMRRPTGEDLRSWRDARPATRADALREMLASLVIEGSAGPQDEAAVSDSLSLLDPLVDFTVSCQCPSCGAANEVAVDLESLALSRLVARQRALVEEVHRLASHYGWGEAEILAVPPARRARYLALIEDER